MLTAERTKNFLHTILDKQVYKMPYIASPYQGCLFVSSIPMSLHRRVIISMYIQMLPILLYRFPSLTLFQVQELRAQTHGVGLFEKVIPSYQGPTPEKLYEKIRILHGLDSKLGF